MAQASRKRRVLVIAHSFIEKAGVDVYTENLFKHLCLIDSSTTYILVVNEVSRNYFRIDAPNVEFAQPSRMLNSAVGKIVWYTFFAWKFIRDHRIDLVFNNTATGNYVITGVSVVSCLHDLAEFHFKDKYSGWKVLYRKHICLNMNKLLTKHFIAISENTKKDMVRFLRIKENKITVIPNGADHLTDVVPASVPPAEDYLLYVGRLDPYGKNVLKLIDAFKTVCEKYVDLHLYLVGNKARGYEMVEYKIRETGLAARIKMFGYVDDASLAALYAGARAFVFPSLYEGFGLPVLEAMKFGVPVICSGTSSLPEVGGDAAEYFDPDSERDIAAKILSVLDDPGKSARLSAAGPPRYALFNWEACARATCRVLELVT
jgi:glycosyltransferase involved in cell wall biosynthesis